MENLLAARMQMAVSLGFHIIFACVGMIMPFLMVVAHWKYLKTGKEVYYDLTKAWSKGVAILFATGAVSGTVLSFELGLLWPRFMEHAGAIFGMPFSLEGTAFFIEAICLGFFLYGWKKMPPWIHWASGLMVGISGLTSGILVVAANAWMNSPSGFDWVNGQAYNIDPVTAMFNDAWFSQGLHMTLAALVATGFAVVGIHAWLLIKNPENVLHKKALNIAIWFAVVGALLLPLSGDISAKDIAKRQPLKLASAELLFETQKGAPLLIGGIPNIKERHVEYGIEIPCVLSFLAYGNFDAEVKGLDAFPEEEWPPVGIVHYAFQIMVGIGSLLAGVAVTFFFLYFNVQERIKRFPVVNKNRKLSRSDFLEKRQWLYHKNFLKLLAFCTPLGFIAVEAGWIVTEVGRQPWIIYGIMKTKDSLTPMPGLIYPFLLITALYLFLSIIVTWLMMRQFKVVSGKTYRENRFATT